MVKMSQATRQGSMKRHLSILLGLLCVQVCCVRGVEVKQYPPALSVQEGANSMLWCNFSTSVNNVQWFRQNPDGHLINLFYIPSGTQQKGRFSSTTVAKERHSSLNISSSQNTDSAIYFCAVVPSNKLLFGSGTILRVQPFIHQPDPSVYKLRGPKSSNTSVCLLTDFASQDNVTQEMKHMVFRSGSTALDVKAMDSKSNGALAWSNSINFQCNSTFETYAFYPSSEYSCDAKLVEKSFETDMNLNFQNLSVIALRILLLKVAGFNLLMTLRLWSS